VGDKGIAGRRDIGRGRGRLGWADRKGISAHPYASAATARTTSQMVRACVRDCLHICTRALELRLRVKYVHAVPHVRRAYVDLCMYVCMCVCMCTR